MTPPTGVLLAGGEAERMLPLTKHVPKGAILAGGRPLIEFALDAFRGAGVEDVLIVIGKHGSKVQSLLGDGSRFGLRLEYVNQTQAGGTGPALKSVLPRLEHRDIILVYGNAWMSDQAFLPLVQGDGNRVLAAPAHSTYFQGIPTISGGTLSGVDFAEPRVPSDKVLTGIMRLNGEFLDYFETEGLEEPHLERILARFCKEHTVAAEDMRGPWWTVDDPWSLLALNEAILTYLSSEVVLGENVHIAPTARLIPPVHIGNGCTVEDFTVIGPHVSIGHNTFIGANCEIRGSIINNNVTIDSRALLRGCVLDDGVQTGPGVMCLETKGLRGMQGAIIAADRAIDANTVIDGGEILSDDQPPLKLGA